MDVFDSYLGDLAAKAADRPLHVLEVKVKNAN